MSRLEADEPNVSRVEARCPWLVVIAIALLILASRVVPVTTALHGSELTTDEADLTLMALDRYFGAPMANTHWPALTNQMLMVPLIGFDFLLSGGARNANGFAEYAGAVYRDPARLVLLHRALIVGLTTLATAVLAWTLRRHGLLVMIVAAALLQNVHLITYGTLGLGNGVALAALIGCVSVLFRERDGARGAIVAGLLFGIALASRNTSVLFAPLLLAFAWQGGRCAKSRATLLAAIAAGTLAGSAPAWSLALLEPIRWLKANLGNFVKIGPPVGIRAVLGVLLNTAGIALWVATAVAIAALAFRRRQVPLLVGWMVAFVLAVVISARSPLVETRYFDAIVVGAVALCIAAVAELLPQRSNTAASRVVAVAAVAIAGVGIVQAHVRFTASRAGLRPEDRAVAAAIRSADGRLIVDRGLLSSLKPRIGSASLRSLADGTDAAVRAGDALGEFVTRFKLDRDVAAVFTADLTEKEQGDAVRNRVAALSPPIGDPLELMACGDSNSARRYGVMPTSTALADLRDGRADQLFLLADSTPKIDLAGLRVEPLESGKYVRIRR